jgi:hypothetical protein
MGKHIIVERRLNPLLLFIFCPAQLYRIFISTAKELTSWEILQDKQYLRVQIYVIAAG